MSCVPCRIAELKPVLHFSHVRRNEISVPYNFICPTQAACVRMSGGAPNMSEIFAPPPTNPIDCRPRASPRASGTCISPPSSCTPSTCPSSSRAPKRRTTSMPASTWCGCHPVPFRYHLSRFRTPAMSSSERGEVQQNRDTRQGTKLKGECRET